MTNTLQRPFAAARFYRTVPDRFATVPRRGSWNPAGVSRVSFYCILKPPLVSVYFHGMVFLKLKGLLCRVLLFILSAGKQTAAGDEGDSGASR